MAEDSEERKTVDDISETRDPLLGAEVVLQQIVDILKAESGSVAKGEVLRKLEEAKRAFAVEGMQRTVAGSRLQLVTGLVQRGETRKAKTAMVELLHSVRPFDIAKFLGIYQKTEDMSHSLRSKSCWLFTGPTGAGKSTTIHYCAGSEMAKCGGEHIDAKLVHNLALASMKDTVKPGKELSTSETRHVVGVPQDLRRVARVEVDPMDAEVVFVDSPGFEDSHGAERDLANGLGMVRALRRAKRVKLVLVFSKHAYGGRMALLKKMAIALSGFVVNFEEVLKSQVACVLTKAEAEYSEKQLRRDFRQVYESEKTKRVRIDAFSQLCFHLQKFRRPMPAKIVRPLRGELRAELIECLANDVEWIEDPPHAFQEFIGGDTMRPLREQMEAYKKSVAALCQDLDAAKCRLVSARIDSMRQMVAVLPKVPKLRESLEETVQLAIDSWNARIEHAKVALGGMGEATTEGFGEQLAAFDAECQALVGAELGSLVDRVKGVDTVTVYANVSMRKLLQSLTPAPAEDVAASGRLFTWKQAFEKTTLLRRRYQVAIPKLREIFEETVLRWTAARAAECQLCEELIEKHAWGELRKRLARAVFFNNLVEAAQSDTTSFTARSIGGLKKRASFVTREPRRWSKDSSGSFSRSASRLPLDVTISAECLLQLENALENCLYQKVAATCQAFGFQVSNLFVMESKADGSDDDDVDSDEDFDSRDSFESDDGCAIADEFDAKLVTEALQSCETLIGSCVRVLGEAALSEEIPQQFSRKTKSVQQIFWAEVAQYCDEALLSAMDSLMESGGGDMWKTCGEYMRRCEVLRMLPNVESATATHFYETKQKFVSQMDALSREAQAIVEGRVDGGEALDYERLVQCVYNLQRAGCNLQSDQFRIIGEQIAAFVESLKERANGLHVSVDRSAELSTVGSLMAELRKLRKLDALMPTVKQKTEELFESLKRLVADNLRKISDTFSLEVTTTEHLRAELLSLEKLNAAKDALKICSKEVYQSVVECTTPDFKTLISKTNERIEQLQRQRSRLLEERMQAATELDTVNRLEKKLLRLIDFEVEDEVFDAALAKGGVESVKALKKRQNELAAKMKQLSAVIEELDSEIAAAEQSIDALEKYSKVEAAILVEGIIGESELLRLRQNTEAAQSRIKAKMSKRESHSLPTLNVHNAELVLEFLARCQAIEWRADRGPSESSLKAAVEAANGHLDQYLLAYGRQWDERFSEALKICTTVGTIVEEKTEESKTTEDLERNSGLLLNLLNELQSICSCEELCVKTFALLPKAKTTGVYEQVSGTHTAILTSAAKWKRSAPEMFPKAREHCLALSRIDSGFLQRASAISRQKLVSFADLGGSLPEDCDAEMAVLSSGCLSAFDAADFETVRNNLQILQRMDAGGGSDHLSYARICSQLCVRLSQMLDTATMYVQQLDDSVSEKQIHKLNQDLVKLRSALTALEAHTPAATRSGVEAKELSLKMQLKQRLLLLLKAAETAALSAHISVAEKRLANVTLLQRFFSSSSSGMEEMGEVSIGHSAVRDKMREVLLHKVDVFKAVDLVRCDAQNPYSRLNVKSLYEELRQVWDEVSEYKSLWHEIESDIFEKMTAALEVVSSGVLKAEASDESQTETTVAYRRRRRLLRMCESIVRWMPEQMADQLLPEIQDAKREFAETQTEALKKVKQCIDAGDWRALVASFAQLSDCDSDLIEAALVVFDSNAASILKKIDDIMNGEPLDAGSAVKLIAALEEATEFQSCIEPTDLRSSGLRTSAFQRVQPTVDQCFGKAQLAFESLCLSLAGGLRMASAGCEPFKMETQLEFVLKMAEYYEGKGMDARKEQTWQQLTKVMIAFVVNVRSDYRNACDEVDFALFSELLDTLQVFDRDTDLLREMERVVKVSKCAPGYRQTQRYVKKLLTGLRDEVVAKGVLNDETEKGATARYAHFEAVKHTLALLHSAEHICFTHLKMDAAKDLTEPCALKLATDIGLLESKVARAIAQSELTEASLTEVNSSLKTLACVKKLPKRVAKCEAQLRCSKRMVEERIDKAFAVIVSTDATTDKIAAKLVELQKIKELVDDFQKSADAAITEALKRFSKAMGKQLIALSTKVREIDERFGSLLIAERSVFERGHRLVWQSRVSQRSIDEVLRVLEGEDVEFDLEQLKRQYLAVDEAFESALVCTFGTETMDLKPLVSSIIQISQRATSEEVHSGGISAMSAAAISWRASKTSAESVRECFWTDEMMAAMPELLGLCMALWTALNAYGFSADESVEDMRSSGALVKPRVEQIVAVLCLLGLDETVDWRPPNQLVNNLVQVNCGDGKSLIVAMAATVLALLGFDAYVCCYSRLLCKRDYDAFLNVFDALSVAPRIFYGTLHELFERAANRGGDVREMVRLMLASTRTEAAIASGAWTAGRKQLRPSILLVDEIDAFFHHSFLGSLYSPSCVVPSEDFAHFVKWVWE